MSPSRKRSDNLTLHYKRFVFQLQVFKLYLYYNATSRGLHHMGLRDFSLRKLTQIMII